MEHVISHLCNKYHCCMKYWWLPIALGAVVLLLGVLVFIFPGASYMTLSLLFGIVILISGIANIAMASSGEGLTGRGWLLAAGIIETILGLILIIWPAVSAISLPFFLGVWLLFKGFTLIGTGSDLSAVKGSGWGWTIITAILLIICSFVIIIQPLNFGMGAVLIWVGVSLIVGGISMIVFGFQLNGIRRHVAALQ